jgi:dihydrofolate reductase
MEEVADMTRIVVFENVTLDGVMQAPGGPEEDRRGGFEHGGWAAPYSDEVIGRLAAEGMATSGGIMLGRRTYEFFHSYWPHQADNPFTEFLNTSMKYVASRTLTEPLPWENSTLLRPDVVTAVAELRAGSGRDTGDIVVLGSGELVRTLGRHGLVDEYQLLVHPLLLGSGIRLFQDDDQGPATTLSLVDSTPTTTGVIIARYRPVT